ncbi:N-acetylglucosaminyl-diphospho-decaprenol L-rhamnosyltransferase [compost metagenome]
MNDGWRATAPDKLKNLSGECAMSKQASEKALSRQAVSVVLLGLDGAAYRARAVAYYQEQGCHVAQVATDAGEDWQSALRQALEQVETPYVTLARDCDFILSDALEAAVEWLQGHADDQMAQGYALGFKPGNSVVTYHKVGNGVQDEVSAGPRDTIRQHAMKGLQAWRAVIRLETLQAALDSVPAELSGEGWLLGLSCALLLQGPIKVLERTAVLIECPARAADSVVREEALGQVARVLQRWGQVQQALGVDEQGFAVLRQFVRATYDAGEAPLVFTSPWKSVVDEPDREFETRQFVELPYYNALLFRQLSKLEFFLHAWPVGQTHTQALEGTWVRQCELLQVQPNDTPDSLHERYWQALTLSLFDPRVCQRLVDTLTGEQDRDQLNELSAWLQRLERVGGVDLVRQLEQTPSGQVLQAIVAATPDAEAEQRVLTHLKKHKAPQLALVVLDLEDDDAALQRTFDSILACGVRDFRLVVLKAGVLPAITTARDTLHFIKVTADNAISHLNQVVRQLSSEWLMVLQAGDQLTAGGMLRLQVELAEAPACQAICANEVQREHDGRLVSVVRPGADLDLLRSRPDLMARHWLVRREAVLAIGGYSEASGRALEFDLLLRLVEAQGLGVLAHLDEYLVIAGKAAEPMSGDAMTTLNRHLVQLGYRGQVSEQRQGRLHIDYRHTVTPLVSILIAVEDDLASFQTCLKAIFQRTRYPRYEVVVASGSAVAATVGSALQGFGSRVRHVVAAQAESASDLWNAAAIEAKGEQLVVMSSRCQVTTPAWIEALLNHAQRPEVGVVGCSLLDSEGVIQHAGFELLAGAHVHAPWAGISTKALSTALWPEEVRSCQAVSGECLMIRRELFEHCGGLQVMAGADIDLCLRVAEAGLLVVWTPHAQVFVAALPMLDVAERASLQARWPLVFTDRRPSDFLQSLRSSEWQATDWLAQLQ